MTTQEFFKANEARLKSKSYLAVAHQGIKKEDGGILVPQRLDKDDDPLKKVIHKNNLSFYLNSGWSIVANEVKGVRKSRTPETEA